MIKHALSLFLAFALSLTAVFASGIYMQVGDIKGESVSDTHAGWSDVQSVQVGVGRSCERTSSTDRECSTPAFSDLTLIMPSSSATPAIYRAGVDDPIPKVVIDVTRSSKAGEEVFLKYTLEDVAVTGVSTSVDADSASQDSVSFSFAKITMEFFAPGDSVPKTFIYNVALSKAE